MAELEWDAIDARHYQNGVSDGLVYGDGTQFIRWEGLISVNNDYDGADRSAVYQDGVKTLDLIAMRSFKATITTFQYPDDFRPYMGEVEILPGVILTKQPQRRFDFYYKVQTDEGYDLHIVYNAMATLTSRSHTSLDRDAEPTQLTFDISTLPPKSSKLRDASHFIINSSKTDPTILSLIETMIYDFQTPPEPKFLVNTFRSGVTVLPMPAVPIWDVPNHVVHVPSLTHAQYRRDESKPDISGTDYHLTPEEQTSNQLYFIITADDGYIFHYWYNGVYYGYQDHWVYFLNDDGTHF